MIRRAWLVLSMVLISTSAYALPMISLTSLQVHNPPGGTPANVETPAIKSMFVMSNESDPGINIDSILWEFASSVFVDSAAGGPGYGGFRDYTVAPAGVYGFGGDFGAHGTGEFQTTVQANSDVLAGYTGPTSFTDGANSLFLTFNDFNPGETFGFWTDIDSTNDTTGRLEGHDFDGSKTKIAFSDGSVINYIWELPGDQKRSFYAKDVTNAVPEPSTMLLLGSGMFGAFLRKRKKT